MEYEELDDLKYIKKHYGEKMSHLCRDLFPSILERSGLLYHLLTTKFYPSKSLYYDIANEHKEDSFKNYIYNFVDEDLKPIKTEEKHKTVEELLDSVGYELHRCKTNEDIAKFKKYYREDEALCTFRDPYRIDNNHIFFVVKRNVDEIKREDFIDPEREDEYSTSVLDLQFSRGDKQIVSIKSRYNHTVSNPDATYSNNLDNIVDGLTNAFEREYHFNICSEFKTNFELDRYIYANNGKFYKYNMEFLNAYFCPDNIIIFNNEVYSKYKDKGRYTLFDNFVLDEKEKTITSFGISNDTFVDGLKNIKKIDIIRKNDIREINLTFEDNTNAIIKIDHDNNLIGYENNNIEYVGDFFLANNHTLKEIKLDSLKKCGGGFLYFNYDLEELSLPSLEIAMGDFLRYNSKISKLNLPKLKKCGNGFLSNNKCLEILDLPSLIETGQSFLYSNYKSLKKAILPSLVSTSSGFLYRSKAVEELYLPNLVVAGPNFMYYNLALKKLDMPKLKCIMGHFLHENTIIDEVNLPLLIEIRGEFLWSNTALRKISLPSLEKCADGFLHSNYAIKELDLPLLKDIDWFLNTPKKYRDIIMNRLYNEKSIK